MNTKTKKKIIPIFVPKKSCRHKCAFCNQEAVVGQKKPLHPEEIRGFINKSLSTIKSCNQQPELSIEIAFYGGSFTELPESLQTDYLQAALEAIKDERFCGIRISTRPDSINPTILTLLKAHKVIMVELGVQSMDDEVLRRISRGHTSEDVSKATKLLYSYGFQVGYQLMVGLPGELEESLKLTIKRVIALSPVVIRLHPTLVIKDTPLAELYSKGHYAPLGLPEAVEKCKQMVIKFESAGIKVIRLGLQSTSSLESEGVIIAGPYHPAFGQLVREAIFLELVRNVLNNLEKDSYESITIKSSPENLSYIYGLHKKNITHLQNHYALKHIKIEADKDFASDKIMLQAGTISTIKGIKELNY